MSKLFRQAFTLIELLVVIAIIGILSGLIVVSMSGVTNKATIAKAQVFSNSLRNSLMLNLVSEWKFEGPTVADDTTVTTTYTQDSWSGGNNCSTIGGTPKIYSGSSCASGSCLKFNGSTDYLDCGTGNAFNFERTDSFTIAGWVNIVSNSVGQIIVSRELGDGTYRGWRVYCRPSGAGHTLSFGLFNTTGTNAIVIDAVSIIPLNTWYYFAFTYTGTSLASGIKTYLNGASVNMTTSSDNLSATTQLTQNFLIGARGAGIDYYNGYLDDLRIYNTTIPASQIKEQYFAGLNSLLASGNININEYNQRLIQLSIK